LANAHTFCHVQVELIKTTDRHWVYRFPGDGLAPRTYRAAGHAVKAAIGRRLEGLRELHAVLDSLLHFSASVYSIEIMLCPYFVVPQWLNVSCLRQRREASTSSGTVQVRLQVR
jgi:hypothetical protein